METISEIIPFAREMMNQKPSRGMLKIYMLGSTLAMLGVVGGLVETVLLPFAEPEVIEDIPAKVIVEKKKKEKQVPQPQTTLAPPEDDEVPETEMIGVKAKYLATAGRRNSSTRLHAS